MCHHWICCLAMVGLLLAGGAANASPPAATPVAIVTLHGEVNDYTRSLLVRQFDQARRAGAKTIILDIDTYGGEVIAGLDITRFLRSQSDLHIVAYVQNAISAGAMVAVACDEMVMSPSAQIGDCAPIIFDTSGQLAPLPAAERAKQQSPILDDFDASADHAGYSRLLLESMVVVEKVVYWIENPKTHERRFVDQADYDKLTAKGWISVPGVPCPVDGPDTLLTVHTPEAVQLGLAKGVANSAISLAAERGQLVADLTPGAGEKIIELLNHPALKSFLFTILILSLGYIFSAPGHGFAEACAIVSLGLLLGVPLITGYANWWEVVAIFGGLALLSFEVFVFPGHGVSAVTGIVLILGGLLLTFVGPQPGGGVFPNSTGGWINLRHGAIALTSSMAISMAIAYALRSYLPRLPFVNKLILTTNSGDDVMRNSSDVPPENGWPGVGTAGVAVTDLRPGGSAEFLDLSVGNSRPVAVVSESGYVTAGSKLIVRESRGNRIIVRPADA